MGVEIKRLTLLEGTGGTVFATEPLPVALRALRDVNYQPFWLDSPDRPDPLPPLLGEIHADLVIVGAGFTGLWAAIEHLSVNPTHRVVVLEGDRIGSAASGRNGGFMSGSLTHGLLNGVARWKCELRLLNSMGRRNLDEIESFIAAEGIDCDFHRTGELDVATEDYQVPMLRDQVQLGARYGLDLQWLDEETAKGRIHSPLFKGALFDPTGVALIDPARLVWGLARVARERGAEIYEHSQAEWLYEERNRVVAETEHGMVRARRALLATNAAPSLLYRVRPYVVPVYDYALVTEPLTSQQLVDIGWYGREGLSDTGNQFHYIRMTRDNRILFGGYDAIYHFHNGYGAHLEHHEQSYRRLASHFFQMFPQLEGLGFSHAWGGAIDTSSRFSAFWGTAHGGRTSYVLGYTGLGVGASRFGALVALDLLSGHRTRRTSLSMVRHKPTPFPPEPVRSIGINWTRRSLASADANEGYRNLWLRTLDRFGMGFDS